MSNDACYSLSHGKMMSDSTDVAQVGLSSSTNTKAIPLLRTESQFWTTRVLPDFRHPTGITLLPSMRCKFSHTLNVGKWNLDFTDIMSEPHLT